MKTYVLESSMATRMQWFGPLVAAVFAPLFLVFAASEPNGPPAFMALFPFAIGTGLFLMVLLMPRRIEVDDSGGMDWVAPARRIRVLPSDVISIAPDRRTHGSLVLVHTSGRFSFVNQFTGFHELLTDLKRANPSVELRGC